MEQSTLNFIYFLAVIGAVVFVLWIAKILWALLKAVLPAKNFRERYGLASWAVVTGGSDGIGLAFCKELASLGFNIALVARNKLKMEQALERIASDADPPIKTKCIVADFVDADRP
jgi:NADPH:quinone reductase-like Zn-dependent oxidoreductase